MSKHCRFMKALASARTRLRLAPVAAAPAVADAVAAALGVEARADGPEVDVAAPADARLLAALGPALATHGAGLVDLHAGARSLEEVYLRLVGADATGAADGSDGSDAGGAS